MNAKALTAPLLALVAACGGGGGPDINVEGPPITDIEPDSVQLSDLLVDFPGGNRLRVPINCQPSGYCVANVIGTTVEFELDELEAPEDASATAYNTEGDWEDTVAVAIYEQADGISGRYAVAYGTTFPNSLPSIGSATWRGDMVGLDDNNRAVRGGAEITVADFVNPLADVTLTPSDRAAMRWRNLPVSGGEFAQYRRANHYIRGEFYGRNAEEAGGVFERNGIVGAFGAER